MQKLTLSKDCGIASVRIFQFVRVFLKLLVQEVKHMHFLLHKAASTKKLPDTSLSRKHWKWDFQEKNRGQAEKNAQKLSGQIYSVFITLSYHVVISVLAQVLGILYILLLTFIGYVNKINDKISKSTH